MVAVVQADTQRLGWEARVDQDDVLPLHALSCPGDLSRRERILYHLDPLPFEKAETYLVPVGWYERDNLHLYLLLSKRQ